MKFSMPFFPRELLLYSRDGRSFVEHGIIEVASALHYLTVVLYSCGTDHERIDAICGQIDQRLDEVMTTITAMSGNLRDRASQSAVDLASLADARPTRHALRITSPRFDRYVNVLIELDGAAALAERLRGAGVLSGREFHRLSQGWRRSLRHVAVEIVARARVERQVA